MNDNTIILWEEKNLIEPLTKFESKPIFVPNNGINEINCVFVKTECEDIGNKKRWIRKCPKCDKEIYYYSQRGYDIAQSVNRKCRSCINTISLRTKENYIGMRFGKITITNQYYPNRGGLLRVDFLCDCGNRETNKTFRSVKIRTKCFYCSRRQARGVTAFNMLWGSYVKGAK